ncbi:hypothetical protein RINTHM_8610 [Richelia intracellularis HM01]|nr:hypothetical protein [Richelia intracellularis]CCH65323.1 hypothetical protein RINTHM_8610 [Richelia intracellularis HM01]
MLCNLGLSGVILVGADIVGFAGNATPELFALFGCRQVYLTP